MESDITIAWYYTTSWDHEVGKINIKYTIK